MNLSQRTLSLFCKSSSESRLLPLKMGRVLISTHSFTYTRTKFIGLIIQNKERNNISPLVGKIILTQVVKEIFE